MTKMNCKGCGIGIKWVYESTEESKITVMPIEQLQYCDDCWQSDNTETKKNGN